MREVLHRLIVLCGAGLVLLRLYPCEPGSWISRLFLDDVLHDRIEAASASAASFLGFTGSAYGQLAANLDSLAHASTLAVQVVVIAAVFYLLARWV